jgi:hypothetical protein
MVIIRTIVATLIAVSVAVLPAAGMAILLRAARSSRDARSGQHALLSVLRHPERSRIDELCLNLYERRGVRRPGFSSCVAGIWW